MNKKISWLMLIGVLVFSIMPFTISPVSAAATTSVTVTKLASDGVTVLDQVTVNVTEMMAGLPELPIYGDGVTHYYHQGPSFDFSNLWDSGIPPEPEPGETVNVDSRDYGAAKGTDVKDLCEMLSSGGASPGDVIKVRAPDGFSKLFDYEDVYYPEPEQGKMIITWYTKDAADGLTGDRYVTDGSYTTGMRLLFFAETLSPEGKHVFGNWDMHETLAESRWHYYYDGNMWPSSSGLSVKWVSDIIIYSSGAVHDVAVTNVENMRTIVPVNLSENVNVTVLNKGNYTETFDLTLYANTSTAATMSDLVVENGTSAVVSLTWNTTGFSYGNYTLTVTASAVAGETNTTDNTLTSVQVHVGVPGDVSSPTLGVYDGVVNMRDISYLIVLFNTKPTSPNWNSNADVNGDGTVNMRDISIAILNFNRHE